MRGSHNRRTVPFRRKREQRTDYRQRLTLLKSQKPRLVVRKSLKHMQAQLVLFEPAGDKVLASAHSRELKNSGYNCATSNMSAAYLTGVLLAKKAKDKTIKHAVVDLGLYARSLKSNLFAVVKGARDGGLDVPADESALPSDERVAGAHVAAYFQEGVMCGIAVPALTPFLLGRNLLRRHSYLSPMSPAPNSVTYMVARAATWRRSSNAFSGSLYRSARYSRYFG